ncbi:MAG: RluA family pseudouridine synthase [Cellvibrionales bacterium]|nr:MAG: RluA family pseudouridine synthase [Cellvibrionales bacterium]
MSTIPAPAVQMLTVGQEWEGQRLDNFLLRELRGAPKTLVYRIIRSGEVRVNKGRAKAETKLQAGDVLRIPPLRLSEKPAVGTIKTEANQAYLTRKIPIIHEENGFLAIDKPAGLAVHGGSGISLGLIESLRTARPDAPYLELVHRLDRETSGIILVAKKRSALVALQEQFKNRSTGKTYLALVAGTWPAKRKVLDQALRKYQVATGSSAEERRVEVVAADHPDAMRALSLVQVLGHFQLAMPEGDAIPVSLLAVTIKTGRTHQIRVHLAHQGQAILGDDKYGDFSLNKRLAKGGASAILPRMFLHAWQLRIAALPGQGKNEDANESGQYFHSPLPPELAALLPADLQTQLKNAAQKS